MNSGWESSIVEANLKHFILKEMLSEPLYGQV
jgi:hypothetical protein